MSVVGERLQPTLFERSHPGRGGGKIPHPPPDALLVCATEVTTDAEIELFAGSLAAELASHDVAIPSPVEAAR